MIVLPTVLTEESRFYKGNEERCKPYLGMPYISYSSIDSWLNYRGDYIRKNFGKIPYKGNVYTDLGTFVGTYVETGELPDNPEGFEGLDHLKKIPREDGAIYEKFTLFPMDGYVFMGFIDKIYNVGKKINIVDVKTGSKQDRYLKDDYIQTILYQIGLEKEGYDVNENYVYFIKREGSHIAPPLKITGEQYKIPIDASKKRKEEAIDLMDGVVKDISEMYKVFLKYLHI